MKHGLVYIYGAPPANARFDELMEHLERRGLSLGNPPTGRVIKISPEGEQIIATKEDIREQLSHSQAVAFNFYIESCANVFTFFKQVNKKVWSEEYGLDGKSEEQSFFVINILLDLFRQRAKNGTAFAFVADRNAELYLNFAWDDFIIDKLPSPPEWPLVFGFSRSFSKLGVIPRNIFDLEEAPQYLVFKQKSLTEPGA